MDGGFVHGEIGEQGVLILMFEPSASDLKASWCTVEWCRAKVVSTGVLTLMFELSSRCVNASGGWWIRARRDLVNKECQALSNAAKVFYGFLRLLTAFYGLFTAFYGFLRLFAAFDGFLRFLTVFFVSRLSPGCLPVVSRF